MTSLRDGSTVLVVSLGGTIAMAPASGGGGGVVPRLAAADLVAGVPGLAGLARVEVEDFCRKPGPSLTMEDIAGLAERLHEHADAGRAAGFVVTQGTDTLEETAFLLDLFYRAQAPVVLTGAMRHPALAGADGPGNLLAAVQTAASAPARGLGPVVVFADEIHAARFVRKAHTTSTAAFASPGAGLLGHVSEGTPHWYFTLPRREALPLPLTRTARVEIVPAGLGSGTELLHGLAERLDGLVLAGLGGGHLPPSWVEPVGELARHIPVVLASRAGAGRVLTDTYGYPGSERDLLARGLIGAGELDPYKSRLLLLALLRTGAGPAAVRTAFATRS